MNLHAVVPAFFMLNTGFQVFDFVLFDIALDIILNYLPYPVEKMLPVV